MNESTKSILIKVLNKVTGRHFTSIDENVEIKNHLNLDSIQIVELFAALEEELGVELPLEIMNSKNFNDFFKTLERSLKNKDESKILKT